MPRPHPGPDAVRALRLLLGRRGAVAVEFAIVSPLLISLLLSLCDLAPSITARYKSTNATQSVADLTTQFGNLQVSDAANLFAGGNDVLAPFSTVGLSLRITSVASDGNGNAFVYWSCGSGALPPYAAKSAVTTTPSGGPISALLNLYSQPIAGGLVANGTNTTVVMVESQYLYTAPARFIMKSEQKMVAAAYALPRVSAYIGFPWDGNQDDQPPTPTSLKKRKSVDLGNGATCKYMA